MKPYYRYIEDVSSGKVVVGENIKLAIQRFQNDIQREDLVFKEDVVDGAIDFISTLKHFTGKSSGQNFILEDWYSEIPLGNENNKPQIHATTAMNLKTFCRVSFIGSLAMKTKTQRTDLQTR